MANQAVGFSPRRISHSRGNGRRSERVGNVMGNCERCCFFQTVMVEGPTPGDRLMGHCHRFPPPRGRRTPLKSEVGQFRSSAFPLVRASDWCGEFRQTTTPMNRFSAFIANDAEKPDLRLVVSSREAAAMLNISEKHLYTLSTKGDLPRVMVGARVCYRIETLKVWVARHEE